LSTDLRLLLPSGLFWFFPPISYMHYSSPPFVLHASPISSFLRKRVQVVELLILQFSATSCHLISLLPKYVFSSARYFRTPSAYVSDWNQ
jgi:hypothetical protein